LGTFVAAGLFDVLSALPYAALPDRELYRAAAFLLMLGAVAVAAAAGTGFRERARHTTGASPARRLTNAHAASMIGFVRQPAHLSKRAAYVRIGGSEDR
jgi:hypothetical protein